MNFYKGFKKLIYFILLYTIFITNTSQFYIFANEINQTQISQKQDTNIIENITENIQENTATNTSEISNINTNEPTNESDVNKNINQTEEDTKINDPLELRAESAVLIDAKTGIVIYDKNKDEKVYPASTTKILTALLAIENTEPEDILTHSRNAIFNIGRGSSNIGMRENEQITMDQALYGILLASANEVCMAVAEKISGNVEEFVDLMNNRAKEIGAKNTHFNNPHGYHDDKHYTTSYDMALIMKEAIKNKEFIKYISTPTFTIPPTNIVNEQRILNNSNRLILDYSPYYYSYCVGGKTGFTDQAGNTLVTYAKKDGIELIAVVMKDEKLNVYTDSKKMFDYGFSVFERKEIFNKEEYKSKAPVVQQFKDKEILLDEIYFTAEDNVFLNLPKSIDVSKIEKISNVPNPIIGPVEIGDKVGTLDFMYNGNIIHSIDLFSQNKVELISEAKLEMQEKVKVIFKIILSSVKYLLIFLAIFSIIFFMLAMSIKKKKKQKKLYYSNKSLKSNKKNNTKKNRKYK